MCEEMLDVFVHGPSGVFNLRANSAGLGSELITMVTETTGIPGNQFKIFRENRPLDLKCPIGKQIISGCSLFLHFPGKGSGGGDERTSATDLQGTY